MVVVQVQKDHVDRLLLVGLWPPKVTAGKKGERKRDLGREVEAT